MSDKKIKISNILGSQIPDFIQADNPLFKEFLTQYYELVFQLGYSKWEAHFLV